MLEPELGNGGSASIAALLQYAQYCGLSRIDAQLLLLKALGLAPAERAWVIAHDEVLAQPQQTQIYRQMVGQRQEGVPVAYLTGHKEFFGLGLQVSPAVLDPRPDTETLVEWALGVLQGQKSPRVLDLGTGSGAIALAIKKHRPDAQLVATDQSPSALAMAKSNGQALGLEVDWLEGDWFAPLQMAGCSAFNLIVSNPPYIPEADPHLHALRHEPSAALVSGADGLGALRQITEQAAPYLLAGGHLLLEHGWDQAPAVAALLEAAGYQQITHQADLAGTQRCTGGAKRD